MATLEYIIAAAALAGAFGSICGIVCTPLCGAAANVIFFAGMKMIRNRLVPPAPPGAISTDSELVCSFKPKETV